jgi:polyisoprenoid-binding protein YceI
MKIKLLLFILLFMLISCSSQETPSEEVSQVIIKEDKNQALNNDSKELTNKELPEEGQKRNSNQPINSDSDIYLEVNFLPESSARYLVREQLANLDFPIDAIGETSEIKGSIVFDKDGNIIKEKSNIIVNVESLKSDSGRRDKYIARRSLETNTYPEAKISIKKIEGLFWPLPENGSSDIQIIGDMHAHGVVSEVIWDTTINFKENRVEGLAKTNFKFEKFEMDLPRVAIVLSVDNNIRLELKFNAELNYLE